MIAPSRFMVVVTILLAAALAVWPSPVVAQDKPRYGGELIRRELDRCAELRRAIIEAGWFN